MEKKLIRNISIVKFIFVILVSLLVIQLFRLQVVEYQRWTLRSEIKNLLRTQYQATRGSVYFEDGSPFAVSEVAYAIYALPPAFKNTNVVAKKITIESFIKDFADITGLKEDILVELMKQNKEYIRIAKKIRPEIREIIEEKYPDSLGILHFEQQYLRTYPNREIGSKIIGFVSQDQNEQDVGQYGVEQYFDGVLRGTDGIFEGKKDSNNQVIVNQEFDSISSRNGIDITLTIDRNIQALLDEQAKKWNDLVKAKETTIVVMKPNTGRIIALSNYPTFDPNKYWEGELVDCNLEYYKVLHTKCNPPKEELDNTDLEKNKDTENNLVIYPDGYLAKLQKLQEEQKRLDEEKRKLEESLNPTPEKKDPNELTEEEKKKIANYDEFIRPIFRKNSLPASDVYRNAANSSLYEPGSVVKPLTLSIAYNFNTIPKDPNYPLGSHEGCEKVIDVTLCTSSKKPVSRLSVEEMLQDSDNIGAFRVAHTMPNKDFANTYIRYGLGKGTGVELADESIFKIKPPEEWTKVDSATASYGQGNISFTPIQLTAAWNALASGGKYYKPTIIKEINDNGQVKEFPPELVTQVITPDAANSALQVTALATSKSWKRATTFYQKYPFAGKTGTANIPRTDGVGYVDRVVNMSYIGVAPVDNPKFTMLVWFREPRIGADRNTPNSINTGQWAWIDIAEQLMIRFNIAPKQK